MRNVVINIKQQLLVKSSPSLAHTKKEEKKKKKKKKDEEEEEENPHKQRPTQTHTHTHRETDTNQACLSRDDADLSPISFPKGPSRTI